MGDETGSAAAQPVTQMAIIPSRETRPPAPCASHARSNQTQTQDRPTVVQGAAAPPPPGANTHREGRLTVWTRQSHSNTQQAQLSDTCARHKLCLSNGPPCTEPGF
eukprot:4514488-Prymnesium_polylepis.1